ncbi:hypothetical protein C8Q76DRAFT_789271 [Earliella scabrosa]|nr:hypothetical protein C8Q76DRAFT_789271 [Earliella scabrosa]
MVQPQDPSLSRYPLRARNIAHGGVLRLVVEDALCPLFHVCPALIDSRRVQDLAQTKHVRPRSTPLDGQSSRAIHEHRDAPSSLAFLWCNRRRWVAVLRWLYALAGVLGRRKLGLPRHQHSTASERPRISPLIQPGTPLQYLRGSSSALTTTVQHPKFGAKWTTLKMAPSLAPGTTFPALRPPAPWRLRNSVGASPLFPRRVPLALCHIKRSPLEVDDGRVLGVPSRAHICVPIHLAALAYAAWLLIGDPICRRTTLPGALAATPSNHFAISSRRATVTLRNADVGGLQPPTKKRGWERAMQTQWRLGSQAGSRRIIYCVHAQSMPRASPGLCACYVFEWTKAIVSDGDDETGRETGRGRRRTDEAEMNTTRGGSARLQTLSLRTDQPANAIDTGYWTQHLGSTRPARSIALGRVSLREWARLDLLNVHLLNLRTDCASSLELSDFSTRRGPFIALFRGSLRAPKHRRRKGNAKNGVGG